MATIKSTKDLNSHVRADEDEQNMHFPKLFLDANKGEISWKDGTENIEWRQLAVFPPVIDIVDGSIPPPTENDGDVYVITVTTILDTDTIVFQSGNTIRYTFNGSPDLSGVGVNDHLRIIDADKTLNNGTFIITAVDDGSDFIEVTNTERSDSTDDEASDSPATGTTVDAAWDETGNGDWVNFDGADDTWSGVTLDTGTSFFNEAEDELTTNTSAGFSATGGIKIIRIGNKLFDTLAAARDAVQAEETIVVSAGTFDENDLLNGINATANWHFEQGAIIDSTTGDQTKAIFETVSSGGGYQGKITGFGIFKKATGASFHGIVFASNDSDAFFIQALSFDAKGNTGIWVQDTSGTAAIDALFILKAKSDGGTPFYCASGILNVRCDEAVDTTGAAVVWSDGANAEINAIINKVDGFFNCANGILNVDFNTAINNKVTVVAGNMTINGNKSTFLDTSVFTVINNNGGVLKYNVKETIINSTTINPIIVFHGSGTSFIIGRLINLKNNAGAHGIQVSGAGLILQDVEIILTGAADSINAGAVQNVKVYRGVTNKAVNGNITEQVGALVVDVLVE